MPTIVALLVRRRNAGSDVGPPRGRARIRRDRLERDQVARRSFTQAGHAEADCRLSVQVGQNEAALVESQTRQGRCGRAVLDAQLRAGVKDRVTLCFICTFAGGLEPMADGRAEQIGEARRFARPKVQHAAAGRMPRVTARKIDVDVVLE